MNMNCGTCQAGLTVGYDGETFCIRAACPRFMIDVATGKRVADQRYEAARLADDDPRKLQLLRALLRSDDYMERLAAIRQLDLMPTSLALDDLVEYSMTLDETQEFDSVFLTAVQALTRIKDAKVVPALRHAVRYCDAYAHDDEGGYIGRARDQAALALRDLTSSTVSLLDAARRADVALLRQLLREGGDVHETWEQGATALHWAASKGDLAAIEALIEAGADPNRRDELGLTPMYLAAVGEHVEASRYLLAHSADPNVPTGEGVYALHVMAARGNARMVEVLLDNGARREVRGPDGATPLEVARRSAGSDVVTLLESGAGERALEPEQGPSETTETLTMIQFDLEMTGDWVVTQLTADQVHVACPPGSEMSHCSAGPLLPEYGFPGIDLPGLRDLIARLRSVALEDGVESAMTIAERELTGRGYSFLRASGLFRDRGDGGLRPE